MEKIALNIHPLNNYRKVRHDFEFNHTATINEYYESLNAFFEWYIDYCKTVLKNKEYSDICISQNIFKLETKNEQEYLEYLKVNVYVSIIYIQHLSSKIKIENIKNYKHELSRLDSDLEWLIANIEVNILKTKDNIQLNTWSRKNLTPTDLFSAARELFFIEECDKIEDLYLRDIKPVIIFQIRQLLEVFGRNLIGYYSILDNNDLEIKKLTHYSWEFIKEEIKSDSPRIIFPFDINIILPIITWANNFVHTTYIYNSYIQFYALKLLPLLFFSKERNIKTIDGKHHTSFEYASIKIYEYDSLKLDFENKVKLKMKKDDIKIEWKELSKVGAYIISL